MKSRFISVEIAIKTDGECDAFAEWFRSQDDHVEKVPWNTHQWYVYFAPLSSGCADMTIQKICERITDWPEAVRRQWDAAAVREFLVGYQIGTEPVALQDHFDSETLYMAARIGAGIRIALYPATMGSNSAPATESSH